MNYFYGQEMIDYFQVMLIIRVNDSYSISAPKLFLYTL